MAKRKKQGRKGIFSDLKLSVARQYLYPESRAKMLLIGGIGAALILIVFALNLYLHEGGLMAKGPLSSNHAGIAAECSTCHTPFNEVADNKCAVCHEKYGNEIGIYSFDSHYLYRTTDYTRIVPSENEQRCSSCHTEHDGPEADLSVVPDTKCLLCHEYGSFNEEHPDFAFSVEDHPDDARLNFSHAFHTGEVMDRNDLVSLEQACLNCHTAEVGGQNFEPIQFEEHCQTCHLTGRDATPWLDVGNPQSPDLPGVVPLETIRSQSAPGTQWASLSSSAAFQRQGNQIRKRPVEHKDAWILYNLRQVRKGLYQDEGLADLLTASGDAEDADELYEEAVSNLRMYAQGLRSRSDPEIQFELTEIEALLKTVEKRLRNPYSPRDETKFLLGMGDLNPDLSRDQVRNFQQFVDSLTVPCRQCHSIEHATIARVQKDQNVLVKARFNHRAHVISGRCLDCHNRIPIQEYVAGDTTAVPSLDRAAIQNMPDIQTCRSCHTEKRATNTCITCHAFHPDTANRSHLLLSFD